MVLRNIAYRFGSEVISKFKGFLILPLIVKNVGDIDYVVWTQIQNTVAFLVPVLILRMETGNLRLLAKKKNKRLVNSVYLGSIVIIGLICLLFAFAFALFSKATAVSMFDDGTKINYVYLFIWHLLSTAFYTYITQYHRIGNKILTLTKIDIIQNLGWIAFAFILFGRFENALTYYLISITAIQVVLGILTVIQIIREVSLADVRRVIKFVVPIIKYSIPLIPTGMLLWAMNLSDRYFIIHLVSVPDAAVYSANYQFGNLINFLINPLVFVIFPIIMKLWDSHSKDVTRDYLNSILKYYTLISIPLIVAIVAFTPEVLTVLTDARYALTDLTLPFITIGVFVFGYYKIILLIIHIKKSTLISTYIVLSGSIINLILNYFLIKSIGILGAAVATFVSYTVILVLLLFVTEKYLKLKFDYKMIVYALCGIIVYACSVWVPVQGIVMSIIGGIAVFVVYFGILFLIRAITINELKGFLVLLKK